MGSRQKRTAKPQLMLEVAVGRAKPFRIGLEGIGAGGVVVVAAGDRVNLIASTYDSGWFRRWITNRSMLVGARVRIAVVKGKRMSPARREHSGHVDPNGPNSSLAAELAQAERNLKQSRRALATLRANPSVWDDRTPPSARPLRQPGLIVRLNRDPPVMAGAIDRGSVTARLELNRLPEAGPHTRASLSLSGTHGANSIRWSTPRSLRQGDVVTVTVTKLKRVSPYEDLGPPDWEEILSSQVRRVRKRIRALRARMK